MNVIEEAKDRDVGIAVVGNVNVEYLEINIEKENNATEAGDDLLGDITRTTARSTHARSVSNRRSKNGPNHDVDVFLDERPTPVQLPWLPKDDIEVNSNFDFITIKRSEGGEAQLEDISDMKDFEEYDDSHDDENHNLIEAKAAENSRFTKCLCCFCCFIFMLPVTVITTIIVYEEVIKKDPPPSKIKLYNGTNGTLSPSESFQISNTTTTQHRTEDGNHMEDIVNIVDPQTELIYSQTVNYHHSSENNNNHTSETSKQQYDDDENRNNDSTTMATITATATTGEQLAHACSNETFQHDSRLCSVLCSTAECCYTLDVTRSCHDLGIDILCAEYFPCNIIYN